HLVVRRQDQSLSGEAAFLSPLGCKLRAVLSLSRRRSRLSCSGDRRKLLMGKFLGCGLASPLPPALTRPTAFLHHLILFAFTLPVFEIARAPGIELMQPLRSP